MFQRSSDLENSDGYSSVHFVNVVRIKVLLFIF